MLLVRDLTKRLHTGQSPWVPGNAGCQDAPGLLPEPWAYVQRAVCLLALEEAWRQGGRARLPRPFQRHPGGWGETTSLLSSSSGLKALQPWWSLAPNPGQERARLGGSKGHPESLESEPCQA